MRAERLKDQYNKAKDWVSDKFSTAWDWMTDAHSTVTDWAADTYSAAKNWTYGICDAATDMFIHQYNTSRAWAVKQYNASKKRAIATYNRVKAANRNIARWAVDSYHSAEKMYNEVKPIVVDQVNHAINWVNTNAIQPIQETVGFGASFGVEQPNSQWYSLFGRFETGNGYSKSFDTGKPINIAFGGPGSPFDLNNWTICADLNYEGWGVGIALGQEISLSVHLGNISLEGGHSEWELYGKIVTEFDGAYTYAKYAFDWPKALAVATAITLTGVAVVATVETFATCGVGLWNDIPAWALAAASWGNVVANNQSLVPAFS